MSDARPRWFVRNWPAMAMMVALAGYALFVGLNFSPVASGADSGGYLMSARLFSEGKLSMPLRAVPEYAPTNGWGYTPLGADQVRGTQLLRPTYPLGLPLHYLAASLLLGWHWGPLAIGVLSAVAAVVICYACARELGATPLFAALAAACVAMSGQFLYTSFLALSDTVATAWCGFAFLAALRARRGDGWALACGVAFSVAVVVRPANLIQLPALMLAMGQWRSLWLAGAGAVPGALLNGIYNWHMFGHPLVSGYGASIGDSFRWECVRPSVENYLATLPLVLPLAILGVVLVAWLPWASRGRDLLACWLWALTFAVVYAFYEFTQQAWWFLRFLLPGFPALAALGALGMQAALSHTDLRWRGRLTSLVAVAVVLLSLGCTVHVAREHHFMRLKEYQEPYQAVCEWANANLPKDSLVAAMLTSMSFYYYTEFPVMRWDAADPGPYANLQAALAQSHRPFYAVLLPAERDDALARLPGEWHQVADVKGIGVWRYGPPR